MKDTMTAQGNGEQTRQPRPDQLGGSPRSHTVSRACLTQRAFRLTLNKPTSSQSSGRDRAVSVTIWVLLKTTLIQKSTANGSKHFQPRKLKELLATKAAKTVSASKPTTSSISKTKAGKTTAAEQMLFTDLPTHGGLSAEPRQSLTNRSAWMASTLASR